MATFFTADLHLGHARIIEFCNRPFENTHRMNQALISNWNEVVSDNDEVWVLGDLAMGSIKHSLELVRKLNGRKHLVAGNHDRCWSGGGEKALKWYPKYADVGFKLILEEAHINVPGLGMVMMSHFPYAGDSHPQDRYREFRPTDNGEWLLHGHVHEKWKRKGRQINVGVDVWDFRPVSVEQILALATEEVVSTVRWLLDNSEQSN